MLRLHKMRKTKSAVDGRTTFSKNIAISPKAAKSGLLGQRSALEMLPPLANKRKRKSLRKNVSSTLKSFPSFRHKTKSELKEKSNRFSKWETYANEEDGIQTEKVGLGAQTSRRFKRTLSKKFRSSSGILKNRTNETKAGLPPMSKKSWSRRKLSDNGTITFGNASQNHASNLSVTLKSRLGFNIESINLSSFIKPTVYQTKNVRGPVLTEQRSARGKLLDLHGHVKPISPEIGQCAMSPTLADIYGQDEDESVYSVLLDRFHTDIIQKHENKESKGFLPIDKSAVEISNNNCKHKLKGTKWHKNFIEIDNVDPHEGVQESATDVKSISKRKCDRVVKSDNVMEKKQKAVIKNSVQNERDPVFNESFGNPWILQSAIYNPFNEAAVKNSPSTLDKQLKSPTVPSIVIETSFGESLGFEVSEHRTMNLFNVSKHAAGHSRKLVRSSSTDSIDSFSSSVHSCHSEDLYFSDSEAEMNVKEDNDSFSFTETSRNKQSNSLNSSISSGKFGVGSNTDNNESNQNLSTKIKVGNFDKTSGSDIDTKTPDTHGIFNFQATKHSSDKLGLKQQAEVDYKKSTPTKIMTALFGPKAKSFESAAKENVAADKYESLKKRRSLDSSLKIKEMKLDLNGSENSLKSKLTISSDSGISNVLSPVAEVKSNKLHTSRSNSSLENIDETTKFFTLPNPKKRKSEAFVSPKRRATRFGSLSKKISEKAQSFSSMTLGSSFKLRNNDNEKSTVQNFLKTNSLTNLMAKKGAEVASSLSTFIRGRSASESGGNSPFKQHVRKRSKRKNEHSSELVYEKVVLNIPRKRPPTALEISAWKKRLKLNLEGPHSSFSQTPKDGHGHSFYRYPERPPSFSSISPVRSPTLLDEIMKSVDGNRFRGLRQSITDDLDSDEDSSNSSTDFLFARKPRMDSDDTDTKMDISSLVSVCRMCGRLKNVQQIDQSPETAAIPFNWLKKQKCSVSLCDLNTVCKCTQKIRLRKLSGSSLKNTDRVNGGSKRNSGMFDLVSTDSSPSADSWQGIKSPTEVDKSKSLSMYELRDIEQIPFQNSDVRERRDSCTDVQESLGGMPGCLLRHTPMMDLSSNSLDDMCEDSGNEDDNRHPEIRKSRSCDGILTHDQPNCDVEEGELFHSCTDLQDECVNSQTLEVQRGDNGLKSQSCCDLLDERDISIDGKILLDDEVKKKKEIRKVKVKSLSSSHDALSTLVAQEIIDVDKHHELEVDRKSLETGDTVLDDKCNTNNGNRVVHKMNENGKSLESNDSCSIDLSDGGNVFTLIDGLVKCDENSNDCDTKLGSCKCSQADNGKENIDNCVACMKMRQQKSEMEYSQNRKLLAKPPLPKTKRSRKVLSVSDLNYENQQKQFSMKPKRSSLYDFTNDITGDELENISRHLKPLAKSCESKQKSTIDKTCDNYSLTPKSKTPRDSSARRFLFDDAHIQSFSKSSHMTSKIDSVKSVSSDQIHSLDTPQSDGARSSHSMTRLPSSTWSDDVFNRLSFPIGLQEHYMSTHTEHRPSFSGFSDKGFPNLPGPNLFSELPPGPDVETVYKYDVCLGYLLHSVTCDNKVICVYSLQRNQQLMESVITPLAALPGGPRRPSADHGNMKQKQQNKPKCDDLPNPAAPITTVPSEKLSHAGHVIRTVLLTRASHMIRDRKFQLRTYRRCLVGSEMVDWLVQQGTLVHSRTQAVGMWQALLEEGVIVHVCHEHQFKDSFLFYRFQEDDEGVSTIPTTAMRHECLDELQDVFLLLAQNGPDAMMRMILRKIPHERTVDDLEIIYEELLHIKALSHLSTMVKRELASVLVFESHAKAGTVLFNQGDEGKSWYIILKGSVNVVIYGKGVVCTLHEGDDFGKLALVNDAPRAATIVLKDNNCHFLRVDKDDFNRILRDVEANTVRLKEHGSDVLVLEKIPTNTLAADGTSVQSHYRYSIMAGTPEKMLEHLLESRLEHKNDTMIDGFLEDFLLSHVIFMPCNHLCPVLISHYHSSMADRPEQEGFELMLSHKRCVLHFVQEWATLLGAAFQEDQTINAFLAELHSCVLEDLHSYPILRDDVVALENVLHSTTATTEEKPKKRISGSFTLSRKHSRDRVWNHEFPAKCKPMKPTDENIFKVYCADHTYTTLKLPLHTTVEQVLYSAKEKLELTEEMVLLEVKSTGEKYVFKENDLCVTTGLSINGRLFIAPKEQIDTLTPLPEQDGPTESMSSVIEMISSREMAYYMSLYDWERFTCVQEYELIYQVLGRYKFKKITANLDMFLRRFNEIQYWVVTEMVLCSHLSKRVSLLRKFIKLASHCKEYQNLNGFFAIVMGLSNIAVSRLSQTWEKLPGKFKKMFADFETLMDPSRNHRVYRLTVAKMEPPIIPFMPLLMKDMTFTHEGNKTYFDGLVNFEKMHMIAQTLKTVKFCRSSNMDIEVPGSLKSVDTATYIRNMQVIDNQRVLTQLSHKLEPRKT